MSDYAVILEMRKKKVGALMHLIHLVLTLMTILWGVVWFGHYLHVYFHNKKLDTQIDQLIYSRAEALSAKVRERRNALE